MAAALIHPKFALRPSRATLAALKNINIINHPAPRDPAVVAAVLAGIRYMEIRATDDGFSAALYLRDNEWLPLAAGVTEDEAFGAVAAFALLAASIPQAYAPENDAAERAAAQEVLASFAHASLPLAA